MAMDRFLRSLPPEECVVVRVQSIQNPKEMVKALECALATLKF